MSRLQKCLMILGFSFLFIACSNTDHFKDLEEEIASMHEHSSASKNLNPLDAVKLPVPITYQASSFRAPFWNEELPVTKKNISVDSLHAHSLSTIRFVGTLTKNNQIYAYLLTPDNLIHEVKEKDTISNHYAKIISITENEITLIEPASTEEKTKERTITLQLKDNQ